MSKEIELTIFTSGGRTLKVRTSDFTLFGPKTRADERGTIPRLEDVEKVIVKSDVILMETAEAPFVVA